MNQSYILKNNAIQHFLPVKLNKSWCHVIEITSPKYQHRYYILFMSMVPVCMHYLEEVEKPINNELQESKCEVTNASLFLLAGTMVTVHGPGILTLLRIRCS